jgi:hypothetical protein
LTRLCFVTQVGLKSCLSLQSSGIRGYTTIPKETFHFLLWFFCLLLFTERNLGWFSAIESFNNSVDPTPILRGIHSKTLSGYLKQQIVQSPTHIIHLFCFFLLFWFCPIHFFSLKERTLQLLFGMSELLELLILCFWWLLNDTRVTWTQVLWYCSGWSDNQDGY